MIAFDEDAAIEILKKCGPDSLAVYVAIESILGKEDVSVELIAELCGFSKEKTLEACHRVGLHLLGVKVETVEEKSKKSLHSVG